jgi:hypothetical protein
MMNEFEMTDLGLLSYYLGIEVDQKNDYITVRQSGYARKVLGQFGMQDCNSTKVPMDPDANLILTRKVYQWIQLNTGGW